MFITIDTTSRASLLQISGIIAQISEFHLCMLIQVINIGSDLIQSNYILDGYQLCQFTYKNIQ